MPSPTLLSNSVAPVEFLKKATAAKTTAQIESLLSQLPITSENDYSYDEKNPEAGWNEGQFHWVPVGQERGNAGRIKQASQSISPLAERTVNGMEALIELERQRELLKDPSASAPASPREAVLRYFGLPPLDRLPKLGNSSDSKSTRQKARDLARHVRVGLVYDKPSKEFSVSIEDDGIGQPPNNVHRTLLSLGSTTKADKWYLIGVFGQGGSSAYSVCKYSWLLSRRASDLLDGADDGVGWTIVKHIFPKGRRDDYYAYLACHPDGRVPYFSASDGDAANVSHGTRFFHIDYDFGRGGSQITRQLFRAMNHVLYNPVIPFDLDVSGTVATVYGNGYRLSWLGAQQKTPVVLDKEFPSQPVGA